MNPLAVTRALRTRSAIVAVMLSLATCGSAMATGINLSWDDCGTYGTENKTFACNANTGAAFTMIGSFVAPPGVNEFYGVFATLTITTFGDIPDWWKHGSGRCRGNTGLQTAFDFTGGPFNCGSLYAGRWEGGFAYDVGFGAPDRARLRIQAAAACEYAGCEPLGDTSEWYAFKVNLLRSKTTGSGSCAGCSDPATVVLDQIQLFQPVWLNFDPVITNPIHRAFVTWQGGVENVPRITSFSPAAGGPGTPVTLRGRKFSGASSVRFGPASAAFAVTSDSTIDTSVPPDAVTSPIQVTNAVATTSSANSFIVAPRILALVPNQAPIGQTITISGVNFLQSTSVTFNGTSASFTIESNDTIAAAVPPGATSGPVTVTNPGGSDSKPFTVTTITSFTPAAGAPGVLVTIRGIALTDPSSVTFGGVSSSFSATSDTQIVATVPPQALTGPIRISTPGGTATSSNSFTVAPRIISFDPSVGSSGTTITINGANFTGATDVFFNGTPATFVVQSNTLLYTQVPSSATSGPLTVTTPVGSAVSDPFTVGSPPLQGINLSWDDCGIAGSLIKTFACDSSTGIPFTLYGSFRPPPGINEFLGMKATLNLNSDTATLPDWWKHGSAECRGTGGLSTQLNFTSGPASCTDLYAGHAVYRGVAYDVGFGSPNRARLRIWAGVPFDNRGPVHPGIEYYAFKVEITRDRTTGAQSCAGCAEPVCIALNEIQLFQPAASQYDPPITNPLDRSFVSWQSQLPECHMAVATLAEAASIESEAGRVRVRWNMGETESARIYRREGIHPWRFLTTAVADGAHRIVYEDTDVVPGATYAYRLGIMGPGGEIFAGETTITVAGPTNLEMSRVRLEAEGLLVEFALARTAPAALEIYDLGGRRRILHRLEGLSAGTHRAHIAEARRLEPGVYFARLVQQEQQVSERFIIVR